jgi:hypothetical protein
MMTGVDAVKGEKCRQERQQFLPPTGTHLDGSSLRASPGFGEAVFISKILERQEVIKSDDVTLLSTADIIRKKAGTLIREFSEDIN